MKVCYVCGYWSKKTDQILGKRPTDYLQAYRYVWAVKHGSHKVDFYVVTRTGQRQWVRVGNFATVRRSFGRFIEEKVAENGWGDALLVHVPSKDALVSAAKPRSLGLLTESMRSTGLAGSTCDALRWVSKLSTSHEGGERRRRELVPHLKVMQDVGERDIVLVDDLLTRGGSLLACKDVLEAAGARVVGAITCGRTMYERSIQAFGRQEFDLVAELDDFGRLTGEQPH